MKYTSLLIAIGMLDTTSCVSLSRLIMVNAKGEELAEQPGKKAQYVPEVKTNPNHPPKEVVGAPHTQKQLAAMHYDNFYAANAACDHPPAYGRLSRDDKEPKADPDYQQNVFGSESRLRS